MNILAQVNWEQAGTAAVIVIAALGGQKGLEALILAWRGRRNGKNNGEYMEANLCLLRHAELEKRQDERQATLLQAVKEVRESILHLEQRINGIE